MIGRPRVHLRRTDSTNERARELAALGAPHGTLSPRTSRPPAAGARDGSGPPRRAPHPDVRRPARAARGAAARRRGGGLRGAAAARRDQVAQRHLDRAAQGRRHSGGGTTQEGWAVLGIGLNVATEAFPPELRETATSLRLEGSEIGAPAVLGELLVSLDRWLDRPTSDVLHAWRSRDALLGQEVHWSKGSGAAAGMDDTGALLVDSAWAGSRSTPARSTCCAESGRVALFGLGGRILDRLVRVLLGGRPAGLRRG